MSQQRRLIFAAIYAVAFLLLHLWLFASLPPLDASGIWFYTGLIVLLFGVALGEPFYTTPARAVLNGGAVTVAAGLFPVQVGTGTSLDPAQVENIKLALVCLAFTSVSLGVVAILSKDRVGMVGRISKTTTFISSRIGSARTIYSALLLATAFAAYGNNALAIGGIFAAWLLAVIVQPLERIPTGLLPAFGQSLSLGTVEAIEAPGLVHGFIRSASLTRGLQVEFVGAGSSGTVLDWVSVGDEAWCLLDTGRDRLPSIGDSFRLKGERGSEHFIGVVDDASGLDVIRLRAPADIEGLEEGQMVAAPVEGDEILYQIIGAEVRSIGILTGVRYHYIEVSARKLGTWNQEADRLELASWLPAPTASVRTYESREPSLAPEHLGRLPGTGFGVSVDTQSLVTHNTAILGILGMGKTFLCFELIRRLIVDDIKVLVLDITGEYAAHFRSEFPEWHERDIYERVRTASDPYQDSVSKDVHRGGSRQAFRAAIKEDIDRFLDSPLRLRVYSPDAFYVTRQDSRMFSGDAAIAPLTVVEVTSIISEEVLKAVMERGTSPKGRLCLVMEEAHSLIPEWNSTSYDGDQRAANATAKAILQGRKYGLGALVVTQRTANVTKTVLNQCHTIFALRSHDATGIEFLKNYMGDDFTGVLTTLGPRRAAMFGKASSCPSPAIVELSGHDEMMARFWTPRKDSVPTPPPEPQPVSGDGGEEEAEDAFW